MFFHCGGDGGVFTIQLADPRHDIADHAHHIADDILHCADFGLDAFSGLGRLRCQVLHLRSHHREALACFTGTCRFDRGIKRQQIGLRGNGADQPRDIIDAHGCRIQPIHQAADAISLFRRTARGLRHGGHAVGDFGNRNRQFLSRGGDGLNAMIGFRPFMGGRARLDQGGIGDAGHPAAFLHEHGRAFGQGADGLTNRAIQIARNGLQGSAARGFHFRPACRFRGAQLFSFDQAFAEDSRGTRHLTHFILTICALEFLGKIALRHVFHAIGKPTKRAGDTGKHNPAGSDQRGEREKPHQSNDQGCLGDGGHFIGNLVIGFGHDGIHHAANRFREGVNRLIKPLLDQLIKLRVVFGSRDTHQILRDLFRRCAAFARLREGFLH